MATAIPMNCITPAMFAAIAEDMGQTERLDQAVRETAEDIQADAELLAQFKELAAEKGIAVE